METATETEQRPLITQPEKVKSSLYKWRSYIGMFRNLTGKFLEKDVIKRTKKNTYY